jgi:hypothetical protein
MQPNSLSLDASFRFSVGGGAAAGAEPAVLSRLAVCCRLSLGSHWGVRPDDWRVHFHSGRAGRGRRFPLQICTTEFTNPTPSFMAFLTMAPPPQRLSNLRLRDFKRATSMRKASLIDL